MHTHTNTVGYTFSVPTFIYVLEYSFRRYTGITEKFENILKLDDKSPNSTNLTAKLVKLLFLDALNHISHHLRAICQQQHFWELFLKWSSIWISKNHF